MQKGEAGANRWRGMLYGMTNRAGWTGHDPNNNRAETMPFLAQIRNQQDLGEEGDSRRIH